MSRTVCIWQHARQAILCPSDWPGQVKIIIEQSLSCEAPPASFKRRQLAAAPQPSPALPSPTPSTSTCSRRAAKAKARAPGLWQIFLRSVPHERSWNGWDGRGGGCGGHGMRHALQVQHWFGSAAHRKLHAGLYRPNNTRTVGRNQDDVKASASSP